MDRYDYRVPGLNRLAAAIHENAVARGWYEPERVRPFDGMMMNVVGEVAEAQEEWRKGHGFNETYLRLSTNNLNAAAAFKMEDGRLWRRNPKYGLPGHQGPEWLVMDLELLRQMPEYVGMIKPEGIPTELADIIIRVLDICAYHGIDIEAAIADKARYNEHRPYRHGGKRS